MCSHSIVKSTQIYMHRHRSHGPCKRLFGAKLNLMTLLATYISYYREKRMKSYTSSKRYMHPNVHGNTIYNCRQMEAT